MDKDACERKYEHDDWFSNVSVSVAEEILRLHYSYATCGYIDRYTQNNGVRVRDALHSHGRQRLRVSFPSDSGSGYTLVGSPKVQSFQGVGGTNRSGAYAVFFDNLFRQQCACSSA